MTTYSNLTMYNHTYIFIIVNDCNEKRVERRERERERGKIWVIDQSHDRDLDQGRDRCLEIIIESLRRMPEAAVVAKSHLRIIRRPHRPEDVDLGRDRGKRSPVAPLTKGLDAQDRDRVRDRRRIR